MKKKNLKIIIYVLAGFIAFQAVSICVLFVRNMMLKNEIAKKRAALTAVYKKVKMPAKITGKIAIVLDDWGYNKKNFAMLSELNQPVTIAILPNLPYSRVIAEEAKAGRIETILHLPLEAHDSSKGREKDTIYVSMVSKEVLAKLNSMFDNLPYIKGVSNHMGSKATEDKKLMKILFSEFKKRNLYFLDSVVTPNSICRQIASETGARFAERSVFLDNENKVEYITGQLRHAIALAKERRMIVAIGHDRPVTIKTIKDMAPEFKREGIKLVYLSEVVK